MATQLIRTTLQDRFSRRMVTAFLLIALCLGLVLYLVAERYGSLLHAQDWNLRTYRVLDSLREIETVLRDDEGLAYCALTGDRRFASRTHADEEFQGLQRRLSDMVRDNPAQIADLRRIGALGERWRREYLTPMRAICDLPAQAARPSRAAVEAIRNRGAALRAEIGALLASMRGSESLLLNKRQAAAQELQKVTGRLIALGVGLLVLHALWLVVFVLRVTLHQKQMNEDVRKEMARRVLASAESERFRDALDNTQDMIFMFDAATFRIDYANNGMAEGLGYDRKALIGLPVQELMPRKSYLKVRELSASLPAGNQACLRYETAFTCSDRDEIQVELFLHHVRRANEDLVVGIARDVSERHRIDRMQREFIATVSHELRTPLTSIRGALSLLAAGDAGELHGQSRRMIDIAHQNSERLVLLINDILDMEKIESGGMKFDVRPLELEPLLRQAIAANEAYATQYGVSFALGAETVPVVHADPDRVLQILANLLSNAVKFTPQGGRVDVTLRNNGESVRVAVRDYGPGVSDAFRARIFQKFSQADASNTRLKGGTGLGLSICRALVEHMHGGIGFDSRPGQGAEFWFDLPAREALP